MQSRTIVYFAFLVVFLGIVTSSKLSQHPRRDKESTDLLGEGHEIKMQSEWRNMVGRNAEEAVAEIKQNNPSLKVVAIAEGSPVTMDYRLDRVRVFYNTKGEVSVEPKLG